MSKRLMRVAGAVVAVALGLLLAVHIITTLLPQLIAIGVTVTVVVLIVAVFRYLRSHW